MMPGFSEPSTPVSTVADQKRQTFQVTKVKDEMGFDIEKSKNVPSLFDRNAESWAQFVTSYSETKLRRERRYVARLALKLLTFLCCCHTFVLFSN